jgi:3-(3-hydroxy-phenyl)propionate hydroxylase
MITLALSMGWAMTAGGRLGNLIRRAVLTRLSFIPGIRIRLVSSRTPNLRCSALVVRSRRPRQLGGSLCPNSLLANGERLDALLRNGFALITVKPLTATQQARLRERGATLLTVEPDAELGRWLRQGRADAAIVRPDRTVMQAGRRIGTLCDAVPQFTQMTTARA